MSEPESLATTEPLAARLCRHRFDRIVMLSDGIFAISATLAALEIRLPEGTRALGTLFAESGREIAIYLLSFAIIAALWFSHRELFARLRRVDNVLTIITLALLCMTALIPAVTHGMRGTAEGGFSAYLLTMGVCGLLNSALWVYAAARSDLMLAEVAMSDRWHRAFSSLGLPLVTLPALVAPPEATLFAVIGGAAVAALLRRVVLPRIFDRTGSPNRSEAS